LISFHPVVGASIITYMSLHYSFPILSSRWTIRQRGREVTVSIVVLNLAELNLHPRPCPRYSLFLLKGDVNLPTKNKILNYDNQSFDTDGQAMKT